MPPSRRTILSSPSLLRPLSVAVAVAAALAAVAGLTLLLQSPDDTVRGSLEGPLALATDDVSRRGAPTFAGAQPPLGYPDATPAAGDPGTYGEEAIGYPEVVAASVAAPTSAPEPSGAVAGSVWDSLAACESGGDWGSTVGQYEGGLQFHPGTWDAYKPAGYPGAAYEASRDQQIAVAERVLADQGWGAWPACSAKLGLR